MHSTSNMIVLLFGAFLAVCQADYGQAPVPIREYGTPLLAPYPAPTPIYGPPKELPPPQIITSYNYKLITPPKVKVLGPYPAALPYPPAAPLATYGPPPVVALPAPPTPVYGPPTRVYGPPAEIIKPIEPVTTSYSYVLPPYVPKALAPYPAPAPVYGVPKYEAPVVPAAVYGPPPAPHSVYGL